MSIDSDLTMLRVAARVDPVLRDALTRVEAEIDRLREQAEVLADALEGLVEEVWPSEMIAEGTEPEKGVSVAGPVDGGTVADARAALRAYREPGSPAIHAKYLDDQLVERCITCLERWPCNGYGDFRAAIIAALATAVRNESEVDG